MFGKFVRWCFYIIYNRSDRFIFFMCLDQGVEFGWYRFICIRCLCWFLSITVLHLWTIKIIQTTFYQKQPH